jgi:hypothetical protein
MPDAYTRRARFAPAVLAAIPALAILVAGALSIDTVARVLGVLAGSAGILVAILVRGAGRRVQADLWERWDGPPAQRRLRWSCGDPHDVIERRHRQVMAVTNEPLPDEAAEAADPPGAERRYDEAIGIIRELTRRRDDFPLVFEENADYGFRRNTYGLRTVGLSVSCVCFALSVALLLLGDGAVSSRAAQWAPAVGISAVSALFWMHVVTRAWVRAAAENYVDRLFGALESLTRP